MGAEYNSESIQRQQNSAGAIKGAFGAASLIGKEIPTYNKKGRWPANLIHDGSDEVLAGFPQTTSGALNAGQAIEADAIPLPVDYAARWRCAGPVRGVRNNRAGSSLGGLFRRADRA